jgi:RIO-like serine/threonine protein kinase
MFAGDSVDRRKDADGEAPSEGFKLNRLDLIVLNLAKTLGPGFALSAPELANRLNLRPHQIQESLEKLSRHSLIDHTTVTTDGYENYRLNNTGSYVLTMWEHHRARA